MQKASNASKLSAKIIFFLKSPKQVIYFSIVLLLIAALILSLMTIKKKNNYITTVKTQIAENEKQVKEAELKINDYEAKLVEKEQVNSDALAQLEEARNEKARLEEEINKLKKEIENLNAKKANSSVTPQPALGQNDTSDEGRVCYLTFDDGPSENTLKILDILDRYSIKATFFVVNSKDIAYVKNIYDAGHTVGLHANSHIYSRIYSSADAYFNDLNTISNIVEEIIGVKTSIIRFPGGSSNKVSRDFCPGLMTQLVNQVQERGYRYFDWNVLSGDANSETPSYTSILNNVLSGAKTKNSACVLMHDSSVKTTTVQALPEIIEGLIKMGYRFEPIKTSTYGYHHRVLNN